MARAPLALLLAAAAPVAAGVWEEIGRNTDVTLTPSVSSRWADEGRAPDVGPVASLRAEARLSIPASSYNLALQAGADRSLDGSPRLDRRTVALDLSHSGERVRLGVLAGFRGHLGDNPAAPGRSFSEMAYVASACLHSPDGEPGDAWSVTLEAASVPRREELRGELKVWRPLWTGEAAGLDFLLSLGSLRATDADGDGAGRTEDWSFMRASLNYGWRVGQGSSLYMEVASQAATESSGRAPGVVSAGWTLAF